MTENEKRIYNQFLISSKIQQNKPFQIRKNFKGFEETPEYISVKRISKMFTSLPQINHDWYFQAPYQIYKEQKYFSLDFFASQKAIKCYTLYLKMLRNKDPDDITIIDFIKSSLQFIAKYCIKQKISLEKYITHKDGLTYAWQQHLKDSKICIYPLFSFANFLELAGNLPEDEKDLFFGEMKDKLHVYKNRLSMSTQAKNIINKGYKKIDKLLNDMLTKS